MIDPIAGTAESEAANQGVAQTAPNTQTPPVRSQDPPSPSTEQPLSSRETETQNTDLPPADTAALVSVNAPDEPKPPSQMTQPSAPEQKVQPESVPPPALIAAPAPNKLALVAAPAPNKPAKSVVLAKNEASDDDRDPIVEESPHGRFVRVKPNICVVCEQPLAVRTTRLVDS